MRYKHWDQQVEHGIDESQLPGILSPRAAHETLACKKANKQEKDKRDDGEKYMASNEVTDKGCEWI